MAPEWLEWVRQAERLFDDKQLDQAATLAERALRAHPDCALAHQVLGLVLSERARPQDAIKRLEYALALQPDLVPSHNGLGRCHFLLDNDDKAQWHFDTALRLQPDHAFAHFNRAIAWLKQGRYREGWIEYEWRWKCGLVQRPAIPRPRWDAPLKGRSILIHTEQGLGDVLQFIRFLPLLKERGARVVLACQKALHALFQPLPFVDDWFPVDEPGTISFDLYAPLLSLPGLLGIDEKILPRTVPYLFPDPARVERWRPHVRSLPGFKVGLCWQGSPTFKGNQFRSMPLASFAPLAALANLSLVSLQKGAGSEQIAEQRDRVPLHVFPDLDRDATFVDSAAILQHLDLVITSDTAMAHLAGALGRPVWVLLSTGCDWRWLHRRTDSPWYPTMRLFRQQALGDWAQVFREVVAALRCAIAGQAPSPPRVPVSVGELLDKICILEIKRKRITDEKKRTHVLRELEELQSVRIESIGGTHELEQHMASLRHVNEELWEIEDEIRRCEQAGDFGDRFIRLARAVYQTNDKRSAVKRQINEALASPLVEEKSYSALRA